MKTFDVLRVIAVVPILALVGVVIVTIGISSLLDQHSNATIISGGKVQETGSNEDLNPVLGSMFLNGTDTLTSFNPINETYTKISYAGNRTIIPLNTTTDLIINATERGNLSMNLQPSGITIVKGQSLLTTKADNNSNSEQENATAILVDLNGIRTDDPRSSTGVVFFETNSTGQLAFLDNMIAIYQVKASPEGTDIRMWEWKGADIQFE